MLILAVVTTFIYFTRLAMVAEIGTGLDTRTTVFAQIETSLKHVGKPVIDLIQVHNMGDPATQLGILREHRKEKLIDFIGVDYAVDNREAEQSILPAARERGIAVLVYAPFGRRRRWRRVGDRPVPDEAMRRRMVATVDALPSA